MSANGISRTSLASISARDLPLRCATWKVRDFSPRMATAFTSLATRCSRWTACCMSSFCRNIEMLATLDHTPLADLYRVEGLSLPAIEPVLADDLPLTYRELLAHDRDMTPTLEGFHRAGIHLKVLQSFRNHATYAREVV